MTPFQEIIKEKVSLLRWNQEIFKSLKQAFFSKSWKKSFEKVYENKKYV